MIRYDSCRPEGIQDNLHPGEESETETKPRTPTIHTDYYALQIYL